MAKAQIATAAVRAGQAAPPAPGLLGLLGGGMTAAAAVVEVNCPREEAPTVGC
ncbi:Hypothetical predicted protein [Prunus dulcis]|uniref:Uncharacterized protein n=1 Tax=Prunus dulcis TaxID=3755 RepID=A0A5E4EW22_PRUDU|nr:Hypothetical predicted protein [Prunus dulcis]